MYNVLCSTKHFQTISLKNDNLQIKENKYTNKEMCTELKKKNKIKKTKKTDRF